MALAARLPNLCIAASSPNADPLSSTGAGAATAVRSAVSTHRSWYWAIRRRIAASPGPGSQLLIEAVLRLQE
jgi:hypothetical protein